MIDQQFTTSEVKRRRWPWIVGVAAAFAVGMGAGSGDNDTGGTAVVERDVTPQSCRDALKAADRGFGLAADGFDASYRALDALVDLDVVGVESATADMEALTPRIEATGDKYRTARDECRGEQRS